MRVSKTSLGRRSRVRTGLERASPAVAVFLAIPGAALAIDKMLGPMSWVHEFSTRWLPLGLLMAALAFGARQLWSFWISRTLYHRNPMAAPRFSYLLQHHYPLLAYSVSRFAHETGLRKWEVRSMLRGNRAIRPDLWPGIEKALGLPSGAFVTGATAYSDDLVTERLEILTRNEVADFHPGKLLKLSATERREALAEAETSRKLEIDNGR